MEKVYYLIILLYLITIIKGVALSDGNLHLDNLFQKLLRYNHHKENYQTSLRDGIIPPGLQIKKEPAIVPVTKDFQKHWESILYDAETHLVKLLLKESENIINSIEVEFDQKFQLQYPESAQEKKSEIVNKHQSFKNKLNQGRKKKWAKFSIQEKKKEFSNKPVKELSNKIDKNVSTTKTELPIIVDNHQESMSNSLDMSE